MDETTIFYNEQAAIEDNGFKGRKVPRTEWWFCCVVADSSEKHHPLIVGKKAMLPKRLKALSLQLQSSKNEWVTERLFTEWLVSFERKMACKNRNVL
jgi:hypothetical protein